MASISTTASHPPEAETSQGRAGGVSIAVTPHVVRATLDRPARRNAINDAVIEGLERAVEVATSSDHRVLVISGAGGTFCAGADLREIERMRASDRSGRLEMFMVRLARVLRRLETAPFVSVAVIEGHAVAGGCEILLACDISLAATDAQIGDRHQEYGLVPAAGGSVKLVRTLPRARANYLLLSGELVSGRTAAEWGLVTAAVEPDQLQSAAEGVIERLASRSSDAILAVKKMIWTAGQESRGDALLWERQLFMRHMASRDVTEGLAAFRERRTAVF